VTTVADVTPLEQAVDRALATRDQDGLHVLGYGEITTVLAWPGADGPWACKRLPVFDSDARIASYRDRFDEYVAALEARGVAVLESRLQVVPTTGGTAVYIVQPTIAPDLLGPAALRASSEADGRALLTEVIERIAAVAAPTVGLDAQLSNWARVDGDLRYFDVSTPMLRDEHGRDLLDTELFISTLPPYLRPVVRHLLLGSLLDQFFDPRTTALDFAANLYKEELSEWVPAAIELANERLRPDPLLSVREARRYRRRDARVWEMLQRMRRIDRTWQQRVRRRHYPFLLPGRINRRL
jgi:uncharacterized protein DUF6206